MLWHGLQSSPGASCGWQGWGGGEKGRGRRGGARVRSPKSKKPELPHGLFEAQVFECQPHDGCLQLANVTPRRGAAFGERNHRDQINERPLSLPSACIFWTDQALKDTERQLRASHVLALSQLLGSQVKTMLMGGDVICKSSLGLECQLD